jgi:hypothetical protein
MENAVVAVDDDSISNQALRQFHEYCSTLPSWVNVQQLERGQQVYLAYLPAISIALFYRSLVPGFAIPKIASVLLATRYLSPPSSRERVRARLMDTAAMVAVCMSNNVLLPHHGDGWKAALRVRALHAKVRHALLTARHDNDWDVNGLGIPINQEDMAATLLGFSVNALQGIEIVLGHAISKQERRDYLALWRYIGWLLGIYTIHDDAKDALDPCGPGWYPEDRPDSLAHSHDLLQSIILHLMQPDDRSRTICHHLLRIGSSRETTQQQQYTTTTDNNWYLFRALRCRQYIGNPLADAISSHAVWTNTIVDLESSLFRHLAALDTRGSSLVTIAVLAHSLAPTPTANILRQLARTSLDSHDATTTTATKNAM